jgi:sugar transferase (PEP-CTERM/EpsH1 system associated)
MRILFIVPYIPTRIRVRPYNLLETLARRGHKITLATLWSDEAEYAQLAALEGMGLETLAVRLPRLRSVQNCLGALPGSTPLQAVYCWQPWLTQALDHLLDTEPFDVIHVEHLRGARYGLALKDKGVPIVWDSVDCISYLFEQAMVHSRSLFGRWMTRLELGRTQHYEGWLVGQFNKVLVTSEIDKQAFLQLNSLSAEEQIFVLPNGVDQTLFAPNGHKAAEDTLVFSGKMSYHANITMALHLVQDIMPHVWAERPTVRVNIVGKDPSAQVQALGQDPRVTVTGYVSQLQDYLQQATVAVAPAAYGAGIQNKVLEAMACSTPVVATKQATAALNLQPDRDILLADTPETFARQVLKLLNNAALCRQVGTNGYNYVRQTHNWVQIGATLEEIYQSVTTSG